MIHCFTGFVGQVLFASYLLAATIAVWWRRRSGLCAALAIDQ
jgi:hypothetical protein